MAISRRRALQGLGAATLAGAATSAQAAPVAWSERPAFASRPLSVNAVARSFMAPEGDADWPAAVPLLGPHGGQSLADWRGKTLLVVLWAEWCVPCLAEMPALAALNRSYGGRTFEILPILTGSHALKTQAEARERLARMRGVDLVTLADGSHSGKALLNALGQSKPPENFTPRPGAIVTSTTLPCLLIVDGAGRLRGRALGLPTGADGKNSWETAPGEAFVKLLAGGAVQPAQDLPASATRT